MNANAMVWMPPSLSRNHILNNSTKRKLCQRCKISKSVHVDHAWPWNWCTVKFNFGWRYWKNFNMGTFCSVCLVTHLLESVKNGDKNWKLLKLQHLKSASVVKMFPWWKQWMHIEQWCSSPPKGEEEREVCAIEQRPFKEMLPVYTLQYTQYMCSIYSILQEILSQPRWM